ncbi:hypothetical protein [Hymenobacter sp. AT01-02]|uniref:hypothetical protein n=1 Tax=Hymenobacter sp. AT01-02 TaxID=1571877 RepID=UPI0005F1A142|nr:hypothetical protein [Hymenobacter sp. AT01-02]
MLYQLHQLDLVVAFILGADGVLLLLLALLIFRRPHSSFVRKLLALGLVLLSLPIIGIKLLLSSPSSLASSPGEVVIQNPHHHVEKLYFLRASKHHHWRVFWVQYVFFSDQKVTIETENLYPTGLVVARYQGGTWQFQRRHFKRGQVVLSLSADQFRPDQHKQIATAIAAHRASEAVSWVSNLLTLGSAGGVALLLLRRRGRKRWNTRSATAQVTQQEQ